MFLGGEALSARFCLSFPPPPFCLSCALEKGTTWPNLSELEDRKKVSLFFGYHRLSELTGGLWNHA